MIRQAALFAALEDEDLAALRPMMEPSTAARGDVIFREGEQGGRLYVITSGKVKLGRTSADGRENLVAILGPGEMFGELSLFDPGPRSATATAVGDTRLIGLGHESAGAGTLGVVARIHCVGNGVRAAVARKRRHGNAVGQMQGACMDGVEEGGHGGPS